MASSYSWTTLRSSQKGDEFPKGRSSQSLTAISTSDGKELLIAFGGEDVPRHSFENCVWVFELNGTRKWSKLETTGTAPSDRLAHAAAVIGDCIYVHGGRDNTKEDLGDLYSLNCVSKTWTKLEAKGDVPAPMSYHAMTSLGSKLYIFSGCCVESGKFKRLNDLYCLDTTTLTWEKLPNGGLVPTPRGGSNLSGIDGKLYVFGGFAGRQLSDLLVYDLSNKIWTELKANGKAPAARSVACGLPLSDGRLFVFGGEREESPFGHEGAGEYYNDSFVYSVSGNEWTEIVTLAEGTPSPRGWFAASSLANRVYLFGGFNGTDRINDLYELAL